MDTLIAGYLPELSENDRRRLVAMSDGSPGRALSLAGDGGLACSVLVDEVLAAVPGLRPSQAYVLADIILRRDAAGEDNFSTFMDVLRTAIATALRNSVRGTADRTQTRLIASHPIEAWSELWQGLTKLQQETEAFNLDKRQAIVAGFGLLSPTGSGLP